MGHKMVKFYNVLETEKVGNLRKKEVKYNFLCV